MFAAVYAEMEQITKKINTLLEGYQPAEIATGTAAVVVALEGIRYLVFNYEDTKQVFLKATFGALKSIPGVQEKVKEEQLKYRDKLVSDINKHSLPQEKINVIPEHGLPHEEVLRRMKELRDHEAPVWKSGKISGAIYGADEKHYALQHRAYEMFSITNPLHPDLFPSIRKFESEVIRMTATMLHGDESVVGAVTSGGTESILMSVKAHRDYYSHIKEPEMIIPVTAHAAFDKAGSYFRVKVVHAPLDDDGRVSVKAVRQLINKNTIMLVGSAPNFPHGMIDPIEELAALAQEHGIGMHTDACLGGYFLPWVQEYSKGNIPNFDFRVPGVTAMSCDTHKYGYAVKGTSVVLFRKEELRHAMYFVITDWPGGVYASPTMSGSRPGGLIACCWSSLVALGQDGYTKIARGIYDTVQEVKEGIKKMPHLELVGDTYSNVLAFTSPDINVYKISDAMKERGWNLNNLQKPECVHLCFTANHVGKAKDILKDLADSIEEVKTNPQKFAEGAAAIYGLAASVPDRSAIRGLAEMFIDYLLST